MFLAVRSVVWLGIIQLFCAIKISRKKEYVSDKTEEVGAHGPVGNHTLLWLWVGT